MLRLEELADGVAYISTNAYVAYERLESITDTEVYKKYLLLRAADIGSRIAGIGSRQATNVYYIEERNNAPYTPSRCACMIPLATRLDDPKEKP